ncbi:MAG: hypothetical protein ACYDCC_05950 [Actinomycetota bacterium]
MIEDSAERSEVNKGAIIMLAGSVITIIGVVLTWISANVSASDTSQTASVSLTGLRTNYGKVALTFALITLILAVLSFSKLRRGMAIAALVLGVLTVGACLLEVSLGKSVNEKQFTDLGYSATVSIGIGAYISLIGAIATTVGSILIVKMRAQWVPPSIPSTTPPPMGEPPGEAPPMPPPPPMYEPPPPPPPPVQ